MNKYKEFDIERDQFKERLEELNEKLTAPDQPDLVAKLKEVNKLLNKRDRTQTDIDACPHFGCIPDLLQEYKKQLATLNASLNEFATKHPELAAFIEKHDKEKEERSRNFEMERMEREAENEKIRRKYQEQDEKKKEVEEQFNKMYRLTHRGMNPKYNPEVGAMIRANVNPDNPRTSYFESVTYTVDWPESTGRRRIISVRKGEAGERMYTTYKSLLDRQDKDMLQWVQDALHGTNDDRLIEPADLETANPETANPETADLEPADLEPEELKTAYEM